MAGWSVRSAAGQRDGLTIYQLQQLIRTGAVVADDGVCADGSWQRVADLPAFARFLPVAERAAEPVVKTVVVAGVVLELGPDGKPKPLSPQALARMLAAASDAPGRDRAKRLGRIVVVVAAVVAAIELVVIVRAMLINPL